MDIKKVRNPSMDWRHGYCSGTLFSFSGVTICPARGTVLEIIRRIWPMRSDDFKKEILHRT